MLLEQTVARLIDEAVQAGELPGAVCVAGVRDDIAVHVARGHRRLVPSPQRMLADTIFDLASLTKPLATATLALLLAQRGELDINAPISHYVPDFSNNGRDAALVRDLLTHSSGLPPYKNYLENPPTAAEDRTDRLQAVVADICSTALNSPPGARFIYSDLGFILLGYILEQVAGASLAELADREIFAPLGMKCTRFVPPAEWAEKCAATEVIDGEPLQGVVHDENARYLGGTAGHAGLFSTAADLARYCSALLSALDGSRDDFVLAPAAARAMCTPQSRHPGNERGFGWDVASPYCLQPRGAFFPPGSFGHSGFTGTSIWIDAASGAWLVLLTNRVHPTRDGIVARLRGRIASAVAAQLIAHPRPPRIVTGRCRTLTGLEVARKRGFEMLRGKRLGLVVNHTAVDRQRRHLIDILRDADLEIVRLFAPEHGLEGRLDEKFGDTRDARTGLPVISLYGQRQAPSPEDLDGLDALVYDIQDLPVRFYTYTATMVLCMRAAAEAGVEMIVFDRPGMWRMDVVAGPVNERPFSSLAQYHPLPVLHAMTAGELARYANEQYGIGCELTVVECEGLAREMWFDATGLPWLNPSPNLRSLKAAILYPAIGLLERCNISVGRGTEAPFELFGAPWIDGELLAARLNELTLPGLSFVPIRFVPGEPYPFAGEECGGVYVCLNDRDAFEPVLAGVAIACCIERLWPGRLGAEKMAGLLGSEAAARAIAEGEEPERIAEMWRREEKKAAEEIRRYWMY